METIRNQLFILYKKIKIEAIVGYYIICHSSQMGVLLNFILQISFTKKYDAWWIKIHTHLSVTGLYFNDCVRWNT